MTTDIQRTDDLTLGEGSASKSDSKTRRNSTGPSNVSPGYHPQPRERTLSTPPKLYPNDDPLLWVDDFLLAARGNNWQDKDLIKTAGVYLTGIAQLRYQDHHHEWPTFEDFATALKKEYLTHDAALCPFLYNAHPPILDTISEEGQRFLARCFISDANQRPTATELLQDAFAVPPANFSFNDYIEGKITD
ncbi:hypothetical protein CPB97_004671 [Podila verticillata]|nr:hypothetical protein CPB97_004671 [Podila verticillata]